LGTLLVGHINQLHRTPGVHLIVSLDDLDSIASGMRMIRTARWMRDARLLNVRGSVVSEAEVPHLGTQVRAIPHARFAEAFQKTEATPDVKRLAEAYHKNASEVVEPSGADILDAAKTYFVLKQLVQEEKADGVMMDCLPGLRKPHKHVPPCMGFMSLRDEGVATGCQSDLNATLTMMLVQELFGKPSFQQNAGMDTQDNLFFGAHCTSPSRMHGPDGPAEPYILRSHNEAGWGCVPQVLFSEGQVVTMALYVAGEEPQMLIYSGEVVKCLPKLASGCRTNVLTTIREVDDVCDVKGMHQAIFYGDHAKELREFCQLHRIEAVS
jgi:L-fucose isomerase-like protein